MSGNALSKDKSNQFQFHFHQSILGHSFGKFDIVPGAAFNTPQQFFCKEKLEQRSQACIQDLSYASSSGVNQPET